MKSDRGRRGATRSGERGARGRASHARPREAPHSRPPALGPAAPCQGLHVAETKERREPLRIGGPTGAPSPSGSAAEGAENRRGGASEGDAPAFNTNGAARRSPSGRRREVVRAFPVLHPLALSLVCEREVLAKAGAINARGNEFPHPHAIIITEDPQ